MPDPKSQDAWMKRVLGVSVPKPRTITAVPVSYERPAPRDPGEITLGQGRPRSASVIAPPPVQPRPQSFVAKDGKKIAVTRLPNGKAQFTSAPPPVKEITFSGGGGKGVALPGAVRALHESGVLKDATQIAGASVGSMTAAMIAAGCTADEFDQVANAESTTDAITEGTGGTAGGMLKASLRNLLGHTGKGTQEAAWYAKPFVALKEMAESSNASPFTGEGLEKLVSVVLDETLRKRIQEYQALCQAQSAPTDPVVTEVVEAMTRGARGPTFGELRKLGRVIPAVKEVVITGTYTTEFEEYDERTRTGKGELRGGNEEAQLYVFSADSEPDLQVAIAVHASASFPGVFKPVHIKLASGLTVRFVDGGVMNNTPTSASLGPGPDLLNPMPEQRGMTFVFEDDTTADLRKGIVNPGQGLMARAMDAIVGANNAGAEYAKNRAVADKPEEIVVVPLRVTVPPKGGKGGKGEKGQQVDMTGLLGGTLKFKVDKDTADALQGATREATEAQIAREKQPATREFASDEQMFMCIPQPDLKTLAEGACPGADEALAFRGRVNELIAGLRGASLDGAGTRPALLALQALSKDQIDRQGYVARELNRAGLDGLLRAAQAQGMDSEIVQAGCAVADAVKMQKIADDVLKRLVYPKMKMENKGGAGIQTLFVVERLLRTAVTPHDVNEALKVGIDHFLHKSDLKLGLRKGHKKFAQALQARLLKP
jgi:exoenzyme U